MTEHRERLTERQRRLAEALASGLTGVEAAKAAGYSGGPRALAQRAYEGQRHPAVAALLERLRAEREAASIATRIERERFLTSIMRGAAVVHVLKDGTTVEAAALPRERIAAAEQLGKLAGDFVHRTREEGRGTTLTELVDQLAALDAAAARPGPSA